MSADTGAKQQRNLMDDFDRIYFDTNVLITGGWPAPNALLLPVLELARDLSVGLFVPEPVRVETEMVWLRELYNMRKDQASKSKAQGVVVPELLSTPWGRVRDGYRDTEGRLMEAWDFNHEVPVRFPLQPMPDVFRDGIDLEPPFEGRKEHGFRDSVIYLAVVEHLRESPAVGVLVSDDKFFPGVGEERERRWREGRGVNLRIIHAPQSQSLEALKRDLEAIRAQRETPGQRTWRQEDEERAKAAFQAKADELRTYIANRVQIPSTFPWRFDVPEVSSVVVARVLTTAHQDTPDGSSVRLTATVEAEFRAQSMTSVTPTDVSASTLGYGIQATTRRLYMGGSEFLGRPPRILTFGDDFMPRIHVLTGTVLVAATALFHPPHIYDDLKFESATLSSWKPALTV